VVEGFAFGTHALNDLFNSDIELRNSFDSSLIPNVGVRLHGLAEGFLDNVNTKYLEVTGLWQPYSKHYRDEEALDLL
jgi:hypothetical protein